MKRVMLFLCQGLEELEAAAFTDVFGWTTTYGLEPVELVTVGLRPKVRCAWNFTIEPQYLLDEIDPDSFDALAIPGGMSRSGFYEDAYDERLLQLIRRFHHSDRWVASVCVGALPMAKAGVLEGRRATTYQFSDKRRTQLKQMGAQLCDQPLVEDSRLITSQNPASAVAVALRLAEVLTSRANLERICEGMGFPVPEPL
ncbi:DJ-1/PfpI family protein [Ferrimonas sp. YFM]|uniref:DJ-1/PfpI family protein n=1 Tax=Ferrimonas sp. YFM TaxID=3028878 RepID=UPI002572B8E3|nr:DJ-1/PfpI family protein [Ferrimonas sp. YFM]BDY05764.1 dimethyladenosine transferase [Ferrimonas sp. YFM]